VLNFLSFFQSDAFWPILFIISAYLLVSFFFFLLKFPFGEEGTRTYDLYVPEGVTQADFVDTSVKTFRQAKPNSPTISFNYEKTESKVLITYQGRGKDGVIYQAKTEIEPGHYFKPISAHLEGQTIKVKVIKNYFSFGCSLILITCFFAILVLICIYGLS
jgi:hypothetical protein